MKPADFDEDCAARMASSILRCIQSFCAGPQSGQDVNEGAGEPVDNSMDQGLHDHIRHHCFIITGDGGPEVQKAMRILTKSQHFPNLCLICRDRAHMVRIAVMDPLRRQELFSDRLTHLVEGPKALLPAIQYSDHWRSRLVAAQRHLSKMDQILEGPVAAGTDRNLPLERILRHFSIAKQRYDSITGPLRKLCCLVVPVAAFLIQVLEDRRIESGKRQVALKALRELHGDRIIPTALAADYTAYSSAFLRKLDVASHDPSLTIAETKRFIEDMKHLFGEGKALRVQEGEPDENQMCLAIVMSQMAFEPPTIEAVTPALKALKNGMSSMISRLKAEVLEDIGCQCFQAFDLEQWQDLRHMRRQDWSTLDLHSCTVSSRNLMKCSMLYLLASSMHCKWSLKVLHFKH